MSPNKVYSNLTLDSIANAATYFVGKWTPDLKRNQSRDALTLIISKLYGVSKGALFKARTRASHASLAATLNLSREWTCKLIGRLREAGWITTESPRLPDGKQEITLFRPGKQLKKLLVMLLKSKQRSGVNTSQQKVPSTEDRTKNKALFSQLIAEVSEKLGERKKKVW